MSIKTPTKSEIDVIFSLLSYDSESGDLTRKVNRAHNAKAGDKVRSIDADGYIRVSVNGRNYKASRVCWLLATGEWPALLVDHVNGDRRDNRACNLRLATFSQNSQNVKTTPNKNGKLHGCSFDKKSGKWQSRIKRSGNSIVIGCTFESEKAAHEAYMKKKREMHGFVYEDGNRLSDLIDKMPAQQSAFVEKLNRMIADSWVTASEWQINKFKNKPTTAASGEKSIYFNKNNGRYYVKIIVCGKAVSLRSYLSLDEAVSVRNAAIKRMQEPTK